MGSQGYFARVSEMTATRLWINNVTPAEAQLAINAGAVGCTQNPTYPQKMLTHPTGSDHAYALLDGILKSEPDDTKAQSQLQYALVKEVAEVFLPLYTRSHGTQGFVTIQGDPFHEDLDTILEAARYHTREYPNIMAKIPAIPAGFAAMEQVLREGHPVLATEVMSTAQMMDAARIYEKVRHEMANPPVMYFAHIPGIFDEYSINTVKAAGIDIPHDYVWQGGIGVAKKIDALIRDHNFSIGFCSGGARGLHHFTEMVGAKCSITINWGGTADTLLQLDEPVVQRFLGPVPQGVLDALRYKIPDFRKAYDMQGLSPGDYENFGPVKLFRSNFEDAWRKTLGLIQKRRTQ